MSYAESIDKISYVSEMARQERIKEKTAAMDTGSGLCTGIYENDLLVGVVYNGTRFNREGKVFVRVQHVIKALGKVR